MSEAAEAQLRELSAFCAVEATPGWARDHLMHRVEDRWQRFPHAMSDLCKVSPIIEAALSKPVNVDDSVVRAMFLVRVFDFCREHFYLLNSSARQRLNALPEVNLFMAAIRKAYPELDDEKRKNQLRNFLVQECGQKWAYHAFNDTPTLQDALNLLKRRFRSSDTYHTADDVYRDAIERGILSGLVDFGQTLHILKWTILRDVTLRIVNARRLLNAVDIDKIIVLVRSIFAESGCFFYVALQERVSEADIAAVRLLEPRRGSFNIYANAVKKLTCVATVADLADLPDIGALLCDNAFLSSV
jgi:hypothetical protein